ncbi:MAG: hypothetical protein WC044_12705 [Crocinitomicaceae bacterium]
MRNLFNSIGKITALLLFVLTLSNCKKSKKGVLEIKHTTIISSEESTFRAIVVDDGLYKPNEEFPYKTVNNNYETYTAYYWPDESAKSLGYKYRTKGETDVYYTTEKSSDYGGPGLNGHWKDYQISSGGGNGASITPYGRWQRYGSPNGYQTDLAIGDIPGEASNRVYMCEHPGSPTEGLYKGTISGTTITWDAIYGLPNAEFDLLNSGPDRTLYFGVGNISDAGKYSAGSWTNTCPL